MKRWCLLALATLACQRAAPEPAPVPVAVASSPPPAPVASAEPAPMPPEPSSALTGTASPRNPNDLEWLTTLVQTLANHPVTRDEVIAYLGEDAGPSPNDSKRRRVRAHSPYVESVEVFSLPHVKIDVALDLRFKAGSEPGRSAMEQAVGALGFMPRAPGDFSSGTKLSHYERGSHGTTRVFVELAKNDETRVVGLHIDVDGVTH